MCLMRGVEDEHGGRYKEVTGGGLLTSVEDPKGDQLNLDNCGDDTNPTPGRKRFGQHPGGKQEQLFSIRMLTQRKAWTANP